MSRRGATGKVVVLTNFVAPYRVQMFARLRSLVGDLEIWMSTPSESDRSWAPEEAATGGTRVQRSLTLRRPSVQGAGQDLHIPWDTLPRLVITRPSAILSGEFGARTIFSALYKLLRPRTRLVIWATLSERSERNRGRVRRTVRRALLTVADAVAVNGDSGARYIRSLSARVPVHIVAQAVPAPAAQPHTRSAARSDRLSFLTVSQLVPAKGVAAMVVELDEWLVARRRVARLTIVGDGPDATALRRTPLQALELDLRGHTRYEDVLECYAAHDALIFPTRSDEWGLVVNEALQGGCPVLGSVHSQAVQCLVIDGENGFRYDPEDSASFMHALDAFAVAFDAGLGELREAARRSIAGLTPDRMAEQLADLLLGLPTQHEQGRVGLAPSATRGSAAGDRGASSRGAR